MNHCKSVHALLAFVTFVLSACNNKGPTKLDGNDKPIRATGSYRLQNVDKNEWGDFLLILELSGSRFDKTKTFPFVFVFKNTGNKTITLDGILPYRQSANPPYIDIWADDSTRYQIDNVSSDLLNENNIVVAPAEEITLIQGDLSHIGGTIFRLDSTGVFYSTEVTNGLSSNLKAGAHNVQGHFHPTPQIYFSDTDTLTLIVE